MRTKNYYTNMLDPQNYYTSSSGTIMDGQVVRAKNYKDVYLSDLLNNASCSVTFNLYRDTNDAAAPVKTSDDVKQGVVVSYSPETNLVAVDCAKKRPSRLSTIFKRTQKMRYVEPSHITVSSISRDCLLRRVGASRARASPKGATPKARASPKGGKRVTRKQTKRRL